MEMSCGRRALQLLNHAYEQNKQVSQAFSAKVTETGEAARKMNELLGAGKAREHSLLRRIFSGIADSYVNHGSVVHFEPDLEPVMVRDLADAIAEVCGGTAAVFSGSDGEGYSFCLVTRSGDLRQLGKAMTTTLGGRGGGKPVFQQGKVSADRAAIEAFFQNRQEGTL
jgi:alanyl-tRNA synthetase